MDDVVTKLEAADIAVVLKMLHLKGIYGREMFETWYSMSVLLQAGLDIAPVITHRFPATSFCANCQSPDFTWVESKGTGKVFSWIVVRHPVPKDVYADEVPYDVALVTLDEGVRAPSCPSRTCEKETPMVVVGPNAASVFATVSSTSSPPPGLMFPPP